MGSPGGTDESIRDRTHSHAALAELTRSALEPDDLDRLCSEAAVTVSEAIDAALCIVFEFVADSEEPSPRCVVDRRQDPAGAPSVDTDPTRRGGGGDKPIAVPDHPPGAPGSYDGLAGTDDDSIVTAVIGAGDDPWGLLKALATDRREFSDADASFVETVANVLTGAIERSGTNGRFDDPGRRSDRAAEDATTAARTDADSVDAPDGRQFRRLAEHLDHAVWMATPGHEAICYVNPAFEEVWGRSRDAVRDDPSVLTDAIHSADVERVAEETDDRNRHGYEVTYRIVRPDGEIRWVHERATPVREADGTISRIVGDANDVTERKRHERDLARFKRAVESSGHSIHMSTLDEEITYVNPAFEETTGYSTEEAIGSPPSILESGEHDESYYRRLKETVRNGEVWEAEIVDQRKDGELYYAEQTIAPVTDERGEIDRFVAVQNDVSERHEYRRRLEESNERLEQFASAVSHDLQEPLRMVSRYLQLIERRYGDTFDEEGEEFFAFAIDGAERMREMIDGLLEYSRIDVRGEEFDPVDLESVLEGARENLAVRIDESDAEITASSLPVVEGDERQLRQVFQNLLANAIEYSGEEPPTVRVSAERDGSNWIVSVADDGIGIDSDHHDRIFQVFHRLHGDEEHSGTGIGLALCERIVDRHDGDIWVDSEPGAGSTFSFTLPAVRAGAGE